LATIVYIGLGSNLGHPRRHLARAGGELARLPRTRLLALSRNCLSAPLGCAEPQPDYVNAAAALRTGLRPGALLARLRAIERRHGRYRHEAATRNTPRSLDLDVLLFGRRRLRLRELTVPHPRMHERAFVLKPLLEIAPAVRIPGRGNAKRWLRRTQGQRVSRTRTHVWR
jgi:2-amino-4-hydroxy-6-hydroxymethyldihydropteridine diphosphokinase